MDWNGTNASFDQTMLGRQVPYQLPFTIVNPYNAKIVEITFSVSRAAFF